MSDNKVRVRFAPSPTGGLHLGGIRTVLFNYLFAKQHGGTFILRIEDTDRNRFVPGAEEYINECLAWCGLEPDESPEKGGPYGPYRQSERKESYRKYAEQLVKGGYAYYAFDTAEELESKRAEYSNFQYDHTHRMEMRNSLSLPPAEVEALLANEAQHVIRIKMPADETVRFTDMIRGDVAFETGLSDDKVLMKADGMPTYHLAVVVDDRAMKISHVFRGEEWLPSAPVHILLWQYLGWEKEMPQWAHLPLILKPDGNGKLSKRDGARLGIPVYAMNWTDTESGELTKGFREMGFLPEAFLNLLVMLGWNDGTEQEIFTLHEMIEKFSMERLSHGGARFDFTKAQWFNAEWIKHSEPQALRPALEEILDKQGINTVDEAYLDRVIALVKDRCATLSDFKDQASFFFRRPHDIDLSAVKPKWDPKKSAFFHELIAVFSQTPSWNASDLENEFKNLGAEQGLKVGEIMLPLRIMLVGGKFGPGVFDIAELIGREETIERIRISEEVIANS